MRHLDLFSGIGGFALAVQWAHWDTVALCEIEPYCRQVLARRWPGVPCYGDIRKMHPPWPWRWANLVTVGAPCQDLSDVGTNHDRKGLEGDRSGLWKEALRIIGECQAHWIIVENVDGAAWKRWVPAVRRDLWGRGYTSVPIRMRAADLGAPFKGSRIFVVAAPHSESESVGAVHEKVAKLCESARRDGGHWREPAPWHLGVADGLPHKMDRLRGLGNAVMPKMAHVIIEAIKDLRW